ncbi:MAG: tRNA (adenosine(37)-N6)-threonylcarbamoyltransferase complex dimerization subunit type 1 TsaB [Candidatus Liberibacter europaeus]|uniref:tRNA (Adenosine(37)-N6)-threonylcarbamoyltransferase complex dimerization subunit type 1 TsaB n=1 Tax=Candidatus Liberibacter europaeus TaxID=744859 RepID=A0A2T4VZ65_9HYPH|nr:tRNA (adenosine(37)-N6)-threonylcarbamoyltransferase complex dimerization subunit type 1 TsaB [Candidatus Liberibacter europaeus]PTL87079.1 MAG: tRNA (adenosine(37)-N6)-threonylcarbamoyltransferase complex dimerization subunit type 1 TsaB [Candidatus Liberibacter europaeus]
MIVLALDTTGSNCSVAVYDGKNDCILGSFLKTLGRGHAEHLIQAIDSVLKDSAIDITRIDRIVTSLGPGSFTGTRVSVAVARGFSLVLDKPSCGVSNLEVLARSHLDVDSNSPVMVLVNLLFEKVCLQRFSKEGVPLSDPILLNYGQARCEVESFEGEVIGSGVSAINGIKEEVDTLPIDVLARLGLIKNHISPSPIYLRHF